ncbi:hypothetical protein COU58_00545 [Candidatus Pacearchaeota archaeon CG10_big_fil_rev_8_21_14_0_10_32_42]|nr:MAG: hypothetical protein COU58_00545 [Candidatus Pacearchaeota archaeon CG10_big_fil_rev_8_21_14_0_10_32_42]
MNFFGDDPFEEIVRELFHETKPRTSSSRNLFPSEKEERILDFIEEGKNAYFIFEIYGYSKQDIKVNVGKGFVEIEVKRKNFEGIQNYLIPKLRKGIFIRKEVPNLKIKKYDWTFNNGVLEVQIETK